MRKMEEPKFFTHKKVRGKKNNFSLKLAYHEVYI